MYGDLSWTDTAGRLLIVLCFLVTRLCNLTKTRIKDHIDRMAAYRTPFPALGFWVGIALQFTGCALLLAGWQAEFGAYFLILHTLVATALFHRLWAIQHSSTTDLSGSIPRGNNRTPCAWP